MRLFHAAAVVLSGGLLPACDCGNGLDAPDAGAVDARSDTGVEPPPAVRINEVVITPHHDWSDAAGGPFDATPGTGLISSGDQYVELVNAGDLIVDLRGWRLEAIDDDTSTTPLSDALIVISAGSTLASFEPDAIAVIGDPEGRLSSDVYLVLRDALGDLVDDVEIGGLSVDRDMEGDGVGDGAPDPAHNGFARGAFEEAIARPSGTPDTGVDQNDFVAMRVTPGLPNTIATPPDEQVAPTAADHTAGDAVAVDEPIWIELDEPVDADTVDGAVTVTADGAAVPLGFATFTTDDTVLVINPIGVYPFDADLAVTIAGGAAGVADLVGNRLAADVTFTVHTEARPADPGDVLISEICADPQQDWNDSSGGDSVPFSSTPGTGTADHNDEWVELLDQRAGVSDLSGYRLALYRGPSLIADARGSTSLASPTSVIRVVGAGGGVADVHQGDRIVIGDPASSLAASFWLGLRDGAGTLVDFVEVGGNSVTTDRGGDGAGNGAPGPGEDGTAFDVATEVVARVPDGTDTGDEAADFEHTPATLGAAN